MSWTHINKNKLTQNQSIVSYIKLGNYCVRPHIRVPHFGTNFTWKKRGTILASEQYMYKNIKAILKSLPTNSVNWGDFYLVLQLMVKPLWYIKSIKSLSILNLTSSPITFTITRIHKVSLQTTKGIPLESTFFL